MKLSAKPKYWFYPDWNGNLKLPENDRVAIEILRPAGEERGNLIFYETVQEIQTMKSSKLATVKSVSIKTRFNVSEILRKHVGRVRNLEADEEKIRMVEGKNEETYTETVILDNGEKIAESGAFGIARLIDLICSEVTSDTLTASEKKFLIGFNLVYYGWASESWHPAYNDKKEHVGEYVLRRSEFAQYLDEEFFTAFQIWKRSSRHGLPNGPGWLNEPEAVIDLIDLFEGERDRLDREEMKTRGNN